MSSSIFRVFAALFVLVISAGIAFIIIPNFVGTKANFNRFIMANEPSIEDSCNVYFQEKETSYLIYSNYLNDSLIQLIPEVSGENEIKIKWNGEWVKSFKFNKDYHGSDHDYILEINENNLEKSALIIKGDELDMTIE